MQQSLITPMCLTLFILLAYSFAFSYQQVCNPKDESSLLGFLEVISTSSSPPLNWSSYTSCCQWEGIECDIKGKVTHLQLPSRGLEGKVASSISNLTRLTHLNLSNNNLYGSLEEGLIIRLTNLQILDLSSNDIFGFIPHEIGNLLYLEKLNLNTNNLSGHIPSSLMNCTNLVEIFLRGNNLVGDISKLDFSKLVQLRKLDLRNNSFYGTLPESVYSCKSLVALAVSLNNLSGQISPRVLELNSISLISLSANNFSNIATTLEVLAKCRNLTTLVLSANFYGESLPIHKSFIGLDGFPKLELFALSRCNFGGPIPHWLSTLKRLHTLELNDNDMTGAVPNWLVTLPNLCTINLSNNRFSGEFPSQLCYLPALVSQNVEANFNYLHFELPLISTKGYGTNRTWSSDIFYRSLDLSYNTFNGNIPSEIGNLQNLQQLDLSNNHFSGHIPTAVSNLKNLEMLSLSTNNLTGEIPTSLERLSFLSHFDVSYNDLEGLIPKGGQFDTFPESSFEGNPCLRGEPLNHTRSTTKGPQAIHGIRSHHTRQLFLDGLCVGFASGFSVVLAILAPYIWYNYCK